MKKIKIKLSVLMLILAISIPSVVTADTIPKETEGGKRISIVFTHDMHSHLEKFGKLATVINESKDRNKATFVLDGGDFSMGTPYQTIYKSEASELNMMGEIGIDVTTLGNHEFDYRSKGLAAMLNTVNKGSKKLPKLVIGNLDWKATLADKELAQDGENLKKALEDYGYQDYTVIDRGGVKVAVFGLFGEESASYAPESGTLFQNPVETAKRIVKEIKENEDADLIVCVSHSGTNQDNPEKSEDEILAKQVDGIDLIVSGHSHTKLDQPIVENGTVIASAGNYNDNAGAVEFVQKDGKYQMQEYKLIPLDNTVEDTIWVNQRVEDYKALVDEKFFTHYGYKWDDVLARNTVKFTDTDTFGKEQGEDTLGNLIADAYIHGVQKAEGKGSEKVDVAIALSGTIRGSFDQGKITAADAFNALSLGTGRDGKAGYPLVSVYLSGKELKLTAEIDISILPVFQTTRLYLSGLSYTYNPNRIILNRVFDIKLGDGDGETQEIQDDKLYRVIVDLYSAQMLGMVNSMSYGVLSLEPKYKDGKAITDYEDCIIYNKDGGELKEWYALASYIDSFSGNKVPAYYEESHERKVLEDSTSITDILKKPNRLFGMMVALATLVIALLALIITLIVKARRRGKKSRMSKKDKLFSHKSGRYH